MYRFVTMLCLIFLAGVATAQDLPPYFVKLQQPRTLYAKNETPILVVRVGNQVEKALRKKRLPDILSALKVYQDDKELARNEKLTLKALYKNFSNLGYGSHKDFRLNLKRYFPEMRKGGYFRVTYNDGIFNLKGKAISILNVDMPDLDVDYVLKTSMGDIVLAIDPTFTPRHARNWALLVATQFYNDMVWHRVERNAVIQTGDPLGEGSGGSGFPLMLEKAPFLRHEKYALGMARRQDPDSADAQFYICLADRKDLDGKYTVFGKVIEGYDVVDAIGAVPTSGPNGEPPNRPVNTVHLHSVHARPKK